MTARPAPVADLVHDIAGAPYEAGQLESGFGYRVTPNDRLSNHTRTVHGGALCFIATDVAFLAAYHQFGLPLHTRNLSLAIMRAAVGPLDLTVSTTRVGDEVMSTIGGWSGGKRCFEAAVSGTVGAAPVQRIRPVPGPPSTLDSGVPFRDFLGVTVERTAPDAVTSQWTPDTAGRDFVAHNSRTLALAALLVDCSGSIVNDVRRQSAPQNVTSFLTATLLGPTGPTTGHSTMLRRGRRLMLSSTAVWDADGALVATGLAEYVNVGEG